MVHLAAVPSRGRAPLGASSAARSAHATEVERWWVAVPRCGARVLRTRTAPLPAATNLVAAGPLCSHSGCLPAKRHLQVVPWHPGEVRPWILPSNATALLGENDGLGAEIEMQLVVQLSAPARTHRDSIPRPTRPPWPSTPCRAWLSGAWSPPLLASGAPPLLASGADGAAAAAEQAGHHLLRLCALQVGCIGPGTQPPASGVGRSYGRPCLGRSRWALCSRWRPSTPSFAPLLLQSAVPSRLVSFGTLWLPFLCFSWVQGPGRCVQECGACQRAYSPRHRCPDARAFVRVRALYIFSPRVFCHSFLWKLALRAGPAATGGL